MLHDVKAIDAILYELEHDKSNKMTCAPNETQISLGIGPV